MLKLPAPDNGNAVRTPALQLFREPDARNPGALSEQVVLSFGVARDGIGFPKLLMEKIFVGRPRQRIVTGGEPSLRYMRLCDITGR